MSKRFGLTALSAALISGAVALAAPAQAAGVKVGTLTCQVASGWGFIFGSSKDLRCSFSPSRGIPEHYVGTVSKFGVDIGYTSSAVIVWAVFAPTNIFGDSVHIPQFPRADVFTTMFYTPFARPLFIARAYSA